MFYRVVPTLVDITSGEYLSNHVIEDASISVVRQFHVSIKVNFDLKMPDPFLFLPQIVSI